MVSSVIGLEGQIYFTLGRVQVEVKPEAVVSKNDLSDLVSVPIVVYHGNQQEESFMTYDTTKQIFLTSLTDFSSEAKEADPELTRSVMMHVAGKYTAMLDLGHVKVREVSYDADGNLLKEKVYDNFHSYFEKVKERELEEFKKRNPRKKNSP